MTTKYNYLMSVVTPGEHWLTYQKIDNVVSVYVNVEPPLPDGYSIIEQIRVPTNLSFYNTISILIDKMYYACRCVEKCKNKCEPPRFLGNYDVYDRNYVLANISLDQYYNLSPLVRFNHTYLSNLGSIKKDFNVLCWFRWDTTRIEIIDTDYIDGYPIYDFDQARRILVAASDIPTLIFILPSLEISETMLSIINMSKDLPIKFKYAKINLS